MRNSVLGLFKVGFVAALCLLPVLLLSSCTGLDTSSNKFSNSSWTVIGPYDEPQQDTCSLFYNDILAASGGECTISDTGLPDGIKNSATVRARNGVVDFTGLYPGKSWAVAYAYLEFEGSGEECFFRMGSDDGLRVWINGVLVIDDHSHRALDAESNSFRTVLRNGTNRMLVKVCQGEESWEFNLKDTTREEHETFLSSSGGIALSISSRSHFIGDDKDLTFSVLANPAPLTDIPFTYSASDLTGNVIASGKGTLGEAITVPISAETVEYINIEVTPEKSADSLMKKNLIKGKFNSLFFKGDSGTVLPAYSAKAIQAAKELTSSSSWSTPVTGGQNDIAPTLLYLADIIDKKLPNITISEDKQIHAVSNINDILKAMALARENGPQALMQLTGYRQMAYCSAIDDSIQPYSLYVPASYSPEKKYSLIVMLHGYTGNDYDFGDTLASLMPEDFIIVSVFGRGDMYYQSSGEQDVLDVMDRIIERYSVDTNRVYLMGNSMGGLGTWRIGSLYADRFAAIAPYCGWTGYEFMENLRNVKSYVVHGNADSTVPIDFDRKCVKKLKDLGCDVSFVEIENGTHSAWPEWSRIYPPETILDIFRSAVRNPSPAHLSATIPQVRYGRHYWITVNELDTSGPLKLPEYSVQSEYDSFYPPHPAPGSFEAERSDDGSITITTKRIKALSVDIQAVGTSGTKVKKIIIDGTVIDVSEISITVTDETSRDETTKADMLHLVKQNENSWSIDSNFGAITLPKHDGGGIADLFTKPLIIVYGTQDKGSARILEAAARGLADWSPITEFPIGMKTGRYTVKADTELTGEDMSTHNIILLGTPDENSISGQISKSLEPYYSDGDIFIGGKSYTENGLCVTMPNPLAPEKIIGYIDCSRYLQTSEDAKRYFFEFQFRLRNCFSNELMGYPTFCPDVFVMTPHPFQDEWSGWFDRNWENLQGRS